MNKGRFLILLLVILILPLKGLCQTVSLVSYWKKGDIYNYKITKINKKIKNGAIMKNDTQVYSSTFEVIDSTDKSYKIKWSFVNNFEKNLPLIGEVNKNKGLENNITEVIYTTSEVGSFIKIDNWLEIQESFKKRSNKVINFYASNTNDSKKYSEEILRPLFKIYTTKRGIEKLILSELQIIHFPFGIEYDKDVPLEYEEAIPNMFGGKPLRADARLYIDTIDSENSTFILKKESKINPEDAKKMMIKAFKLMDLNTKKMKKNSKIDIVDDIRFKYDYYSGIPLLIKYKRNTIVNINGSKGGRVDEVFIELIKNN